MFEKLTVIAPGLLGASIGMAAQQRSIAKRISVWARRAEARQVLESKDWCDEAPPSLKDACSGSSLILLCAPVERINELASNISPILDSNPIVTDVGSVKSKLSRHCHSVLESKGRFVGSHPMAGSEKTGMENADANLFEGNTCFVTPLEETDSSAAKSVSDFWISLGANVLQESPERHDAIVANVSHLPHLLASSLANYLSTTLPAAAKFCGNGLKDTTRIASGDPQMWLDIIVQNRPEIIRSLDALQNEIQSLRTDITNEDYFTVFGKLAKGKAFRDQLDP
ncbi:MAG TPA: prephenate dehydrogenase/arogenate dehydrogenase family protein [Opitutae bacterium]|nr:prephenate dehydrogenase/arogenate dehydrogenase family protein [Opitutae bacterium]